MGNCQAIDAATLVVQHSSGKVDKLYWPVPASEIMKMNPGHYVALLITTTICHTTPTSAKTSNSQKTSNTSQKPNCNSQKDSSSSYNRLINASNSNKGSDNKNRRTTTISTEDGRNTVRITRVKLLRPTDTLALGHVYRLISTQEVMKGLVAKKQAKMRKNNIELADSEGLKEAAKIAKRSQQEKTHQVSRHGHRSRTPSASNGGAARPKNWQPSLHSISEAAS